MTQRARDILDRDRFRGAGQRATEVVAAQRRVVLERFFTWGTDENDLRETGCDRFLEGERHLRINQETQIIRISGYVRPEDVRIDNTVPSKLVANARIEYSGEGVIAETQSVPWLARLFSWMLPF